MATRKQPGEEKELPLINFKLRPEISMSVSIQKKESKDFEYKVAGENTDRSKKIIKFLFLELDVESYNDLNKYPEIRDANNYWRDNFFKLLKRLKGIEKNRFSKYLKEELINPYINEDKFKNGIS